MKIKKPLWLALVVLISLTVRSNAATITYLLDISSGLAHYSGGFTGRAEGDLVIEGRFKLHIDSDINYAAFENVDITFGGYSGIPMGLDWSSLTGTISGTSIFLSSTDPHMGFDNQLWGTFDGNSAELAGYLYDAVYDGLQYDCTISADVIPAVPGDFDVNGVLDGTDLVMLYDAVNSAPGNVFYDLDGDDLVNEADLDIWVTELYGTAVSDFDLDYDSDVDDLIIWKTNRFQSGLTFLEGDADFDGDVDVDDLNLWKDNRFTSHGPMGGAAAPEPASLSLMAFGGALLLRRR